MKKRLMKMSWAVACLALYACQTGPDPDPVPGTIEHDMQILKSDETIAEYLMESVELGRNEAALAIFALDGFEYDMRPQDMARHAAEAVADHCSETCVTATAYYDTLIYSFDGCYCDFGMELVTGTLQVVYTRDDDCFIARMEARDFRVSGATMDIDAFGLIYDSYGDHEMSVKSRSTGVGSRNLAITTRVGHYDLSWDDDEMRCLSMDGSWGTNANHSLPFMTGVHGMNHCGGRCPKLGGLASFGHSGEIHVKVFFDGSDSVTWASSRGTSGEIVLPCY